MDDKKQTITNLFNKKPPKTISLKAGIIVAILFLVIGVWIGIFIFSSINAHFAGNNQPITPKQSKIIKPAQNQSAEPKIVVIGNSSQAESSLPTEAVTSSPVNSSAPEKSIVAEKAKHPTVSPPVIAKLARHKANGAVKHVTHWTIQVASYKNKGNAIRMLGRLALNSLPAHIKEVKRKKRHFYRVVISYKGSKKGIAEIVKEIKNKLHITPFVYDPVS